MRCGLGYRTIGARALRTARWSCALLLAAASHGAAAQTDEIQVYDAEIAAPGVFNLTWHNNYTPSGGRTPDIPGGVVPEHSFNGVTEWAYGVTDWFEAGLYAPLYSVTDGKVLYDGVKLRTLFVKPDAAHSRFFYGVNFEFSFNTRHWDPDRYTSEIRPIIGWHLGRLDVIFNPILDNSYQGLGNLELVPATRIAWNFPGRWTIAAEEYAGFGPVRHLLGGDAQSHELYAVADYKGQSWSFEAGVGFGLTAASDHRMVKLILMHDFNGGR
jgi:hypothetical protein